MGAGIGFSTDAQRSQEQNRRMIHKHKPYEQMNHNRLMQSPKFSFKEMLPEDLEQFRQTLQAKAKKEWLIQWCIGTLLFVGMLGMACWFIFH